MNDLSVSSPSTALADAGAMSDVQSERRKERRPVGINWYANRHIYDALVGLRRDVYSVVRHGLRFEFLLDSEANRFGREVFWLYALKLHEASFKDGKLQIGKELYSRSDGDPRICIPLSHFVGFGDPFIGWPDLDEELADLGDQMVKVVHAEIAYVAQRNL